MKKFVKSSIINTRFFLKDNTITFVFISLFTLATLGGSFALCLTAHSDTVLSLILKQYFSENESLSIIELFSRNVIAAFICLVLMYIGGLCAIGIPIVSIIPIIKGISIGAIISYQYVYNGIKGFLYTVVILLLPQALYMAIFTLAYTEGFYMSLSVSNGIFAGKPRNLKYSVNFLTFTKRFIIFSVCIVFISLLEATVSSLFSSLL